MEMELTNNVTTVGGESHIDSPSFLRSVIDLVRGMITMRSVNKTYENDLKLLSGETSDEIIDLRLKQIKNNEKNKKDNLKKYEKINNEVLKIAAELSPDKSELDENVVNNISIKNDMIRVYKILSINKITEKWIKYCYYYMSNPKAFLLLHIPENVKELCNGICKVFNFGKMYPNANTANLDQYDIKNIKFDPAFVLSVDSIKSHNTVEFQNAIADRLAYAPLPELAIGTVDSAIDNNGMIVPFVISQPNDNNTISDKPLVENNGIDEGIFHMLEYYIEPISIKLNNTKRVYKKSELNDFRVTLELYNGDYPNSYEIDITSLGKESPSLIANEYDNDKVLVPLYHPLVTKILANPMACIEEQEKIQLHADMFSSMEIYYAIDLGDVVVRNLSSTERAELENRLSRIIRYWSSKNPIVRLRFESYESPSKFVLTSNGARTPLSDLNANAIECDNLVIAVDGDDIVIRDLDKVENIKFI